MSYFKALGMDNTEERLHGDKSNEPKSSEQGCSPQVWILIIMAGIGFIVMFADSLSFIMMLFGMGAIVYYVILGLLR